MSKKLIIVMGVSGCGKSTIGKGIAKELGIEFYDGDDFHPLANIDKMASGQPLNDEDRRPWLEAINEFARDAVLEQSIVIACSALKEEYRIILSNNIVTAFIFLKGSRALIFERMKQRKGHYMQAAMLDSQFDALEIPVDAIELDIAKTVSEITTEALRRLV